MNTSLLKFKPITQPKQTRAENVLNGNDAEIYSASMLLKAIGAEVSWGSRNEDGRKIDLICSYDHPWIEKERIVFMVQVKSGPTYGELHPTGFKLLKAAKDAAIRTSHPICVIWVDRDTNSSFWAYVHPTSTQNNQYYSNIHKIEPSMRFDIARCQARGIPLKKGGSGVIISELTGNLKSKRLEALKNYKALKTNPPIHPNLGKVEFTRIGWRHMFRKTRSAEFKSKSLNVIPYLGQILKDKPSEIYISNHNFSEQNGFQYRNSHFVLKFNDVKLFNNVNFDVEPVTVVIRLVEEIRWSDKWKNETMLSQKIDRRLVLLSSYYK